MFRKNALKAWLTSRNKAVCDAVSLPTHAGGFFFSVYYIQAKQEQLRTLTSMYRHPQSHYNVFLDTKVFSFEGKDERKIKGILKMWRCTRLFMKNISGWKLKLLSCKVVGLSQTDDTITVDTSTNSMRSLKNAFSPLSMMWNRFFFQNSLPPKT